MTESNPDEVRAGAPLDLGSIRDRVDHANAGGPCGPLVDDVYALLAEVDRLTGLAETTRADERDRITAEIKAHADWLRKHATDAVDRARWIGADEAWKTARGTR